MVLICVFLMINHVDLLSCVKHTLSCVCWTFVYLLGRDVYSDPLLVFSVGCLISESSFIYVFCVSSLVKCFLPMIFPVYDLSFPCIKV